MKQDQKIQVFAWGLSLIVTIMAVLAWAQSNSWRLSGLTTYQVFPLLGLVAFSLMWSHYITGVFRRMVGGEKAALKNYFAVTGYIVLAAILLHPGLLIYQLYRDGQGLPPQSYLHYVAPSLGGAVLLGTAAFVLFMLYEFHRIWGNKPWWKFVQYGSDLAMFLIFVHALRLGDVMALSWFRALWYFYGLTLLVALIYIYGIAKPPQKQS